MKVETIELPPFLHSYRAIRPCRDPLPHSLEDLDRKVGLDLGVVGLVGGFLGQSADKVTTMDDYKNIVGDTNLSSISSRCPPWCGGH